MSKKGKIRGRLDVVKADPRHDVVYVKMKDGSIHEVAIMPKGHYRVRGKLRPGRRRKHVKHHRTHHRKSRK